MRPQDKETIEHQAGLIEQYKRSYHQAAAELQLARDLLAVIGDVATLPLPLKGDWEAFDRENRMRMPVIRGAAALGSVGQLAATLRAEIRALQAIAAAPLSYTPSGGALPKPPMPESDAERAAALGGGVLVPKFTPHPDSPVSSTSATGVLRLCDCPEREGRIYHQRETCTDPLVVKLDWFASGVTGVDYDRAVRREAARAASAGEVPAFLAAEAPSTTGAEFWTDQERCIAAAAADVGEHQGDEPAAAVVDGEPACMCSDPDCPDAVHQEPAAAAVDDGEHQGDEPAAVDIMHAAGLLGIPLEPAGDVGEPAAAAVDVGEAPRCGTCGRVEGMPTAPCERCPDYAPGWTYARSGSQTL